MSRGTKINTSYFVVLYVSSPDEDTKYAFIASKKVGNAVKRNRAKRLLSEAVRTLEPPLPFGKWYVFVARSQAAGSHTSSIKSTLEGIRSRVK